MTLRTYLFSSTFWLIYFVTLLLAVSSVLDVKVLMLIDQIYGSQTVQQDIRTIAILLVSKSIYTIGLTYLLSYLTFKNYTRLVSSRFTDTFKLRSGDFEKNELANYIANESLQFYLTIILPVCVMISTFIQLIVLLIGTNIVLGTEVLIVFCVVGAIYTLYLLPVQYVLSRQGQKRRKAEETRLNFLSNATNSINDIRFGKFFEVAKAKHIDAPSDDIRRALTTKWANAEAQKYILELCGLMGVSVWYVFAKPDTAQLLALASLVFILYRMAPLVTRFIVAYQSFSYGRSSFKEPLKSEFLPDYQAIVSEDIMAIQYNGQMMELNNTNKGITIISGPSGVGKSTLLNCLGNTYEQHKYVVGYISQQPLVVKGSLRDNLFMQNLYDADLAAQLGLTKLSVERNLLTFDSVSGGEALRIALFRNLVLKPDVLLLDEPFSALDEENKKIVVEILNNLNQDLHIICVSHEIPKTLETEHVITITK